MSVNWNHAHILHNYTKRGICTRQTGEGGEKTCYMKGKQPGNEKTARE